MKLKSVELIGEEEGVFINIIMNKLIARESAANINRKLEKALEENAEVCFINKTGSSLQTIQNTDI